MLEGYEPQPAQPVGSGRGVCGRRLVGGPAPSITVASQELTVWTSGTWTLVPGRCTFATARTSRSVTAQRTLTLG
ncbi:hypothetical protein GCM10010446_09580 [Streptomyces enissocaesilis]|uniref:Uncharacterized protein n=1 Tax=Streptomyces enissocaesilis TaxID=332589 RepID=A0ABP6JAM9_9ACTN